MANNRKQSGQLARRLEISLHRSLKLDINFTPAFIKPIQDQQHLRSTFFYILKQNTHHQTQFDPYHDGSNFPDLIGLRCLNSSSIECIRRYLPRVSRKIILEELNLSPDTPISDFSQIKHATAAAIAREDLYGRNVSITAAKIAALQLTKNHLQVSEIISLLQISRAFYYKKHTLRSPTINKLQAAIKSQLQIRQRE